MARFGYPPVHGLIVDACAASHGGDGSERRDRQSVCIHLIALCAVIYGAETPRGRVVLLQRLTRRKVEWPVLKRPVGVPGLSHWHAVGAADIDDYTKRAGEWAGAVWAFWYPEHDRIRAMLDAQPRTGAPLREPRREIARTPLRGAWQHRCRLGDGRPWPRSVRPPPTRNQRLPPRVRPPRQGSVRRAGHCQHDSAPWLARSARLPS